MKRQKQVIIECINSTVLSWYSQFRKYLYPMLTTAELGRICKEQWIKIAPNICTNYISH